MENKFDLIRSEVLVNRKSFDTEGLPQTRFKTLSKEIQNLLDELPTVDGNHLDFNEDGDGFYTSFLDGKQQFYKLKIKDKLYFVDTQGYDYARYVGELT